MNTTSSGGGDDAQRPLADLCLSTLSHLAGLSGGRCRADQLRAPLQDLEQYAEAGLIELLDRRPMLATRSRDGDAPVIADVSVYGITSKGRAALAEAYRR